MNFKTFSLICTLSLFLLGCGIKSKPSYPKERTLPSYIEKFTTSPAVD